MSASKLSPLLVCLLAVFSFSACKKSTPQASSDTSSISGCKCDDLSCWEKATDKGVNQSLQCAKTAGLAAASVAGVGAASFFAGIAELGFAFSSGNIAGMLNGAAGITEGASGLTGSKSYKCLEESASMIKDLLSFYDAAQSVQKDDFRSVFQVISKSPEVLKASVTFIGVLESCGALAEGSLGAEFDAVKSGFKKIADAGAVIFVMYDCGMALEAGGILIENTSCLASDLQKLYDQLDALERQNDNLQNDPFKKGDKNSTTMCGDQPRNCAVGAMTKFGSYLSQLPLGIFSRAEQCALHCKNPSRLSKKTAEWQTCYKAGTELFKNEAPACRDICEVEQCGNAIESCIALCCNQDSGCTNAANKN